MRLIGPIRGKEAGAWGWKLYGSLEDISKEKSRHVQTIMKAEGAVPLSYRRFIRDPL